MTKFIELNSSKLHTISYKDVHNKKTLIVGDLGTGKTKLLIKLLNEAIEMGLGNKITIIDMAPKVIMQNEKKIGGTLLVYNPEVKNLRYLASENIKAPRLLSKNAKELIFFAQENKKIIDSFFDAFIKNPSSILFINDVSIYFHLGSINPILEVLELVDTFIANGYYGRSLLEDFNTGISKKEMECMEALMEKMDIVIRLNA
jgi:GTPase SAR1 family protein